MLRDSESNGRGRAISSSALEGRVGRIHGPACVLSRGALPLFTALALALSSTAGGCTVFDGLTATAPESSGTSSTGTGTTTGSTGGEGGAGGIGGTTSAGGAGGAGGAVGAGGAGGGAGGGSSAKCAQLSLKGPAMVDVPASANADAYCIDATEITRDQYNEFLATGPDLNLAPPCSGNVSFTPTQGWPPKSNQKSFPVIGVDFCDAAAYCEWAGKRLCGHVGGGSIDVAGGDAPQDSQWQSACSNGGAVDFPYGDAYGPQTCNGQDYGMNTPAKVQSVLGCVGGVAGLFDMSGNVREWEDACDGDNCRVRGGSYDDSEADLSCAASITLDRYTTDAFTGFRCCKD